MTETDPQEEAEAATEPTEDLRAFGCPLTSSTAGQSVIHPNRDNWLLVASAILNDGFRMCIDLTAVDYLTFKAPRTFPTEISAERYEVVASFLNFDRRERIRARIQVPEDDLAVPSLHSLYPGSDYLEREVFDMFGIVFDGHPDLSRILMPESWDGHPLRKDYAIGAIPVQFKGTESKGRFDGI